MTISYKKILLSQNPQVENYTKTSENQNLNDFLLEIWLESIIASD